MTGVYAEDVAIEPFLPAGRRNDTDNIGPRVGATFAVTDRTVLRGGFGKYFADIGANRAYWTNLVSQALHVQVFNDGRAGLRHQSVQRTCADLRPGGADALLGQQRAGVPAPHAVEHAGGAGERHSLQLPGIVRLPAATGNLDGGRSRLRLHGDAAPARGDEPEPRVRPEDRCELSPIPTSATCHTRTGASSRSSSTSANRTITPCRSASRNG